jgi:hypothetical protein
MYEWDGQTHAFNQTAESIVQDLLNAHLARKQLQRIMRDKVVYVDGGKVWQTTSIKNADTRADYITLRKREGKTVLNTLPIDEAVKIFREVA